MARKIKKVRQFAFHCRNTETGEHGTFMFQADNLDLAEAHRWMLHNDPSSAYECAGYVGPMRGGVWTPENEIRGFVSEAVAHEEHLATLPEIDHDPAMLAEFIADRGRRPERGARLDRNLLNPNGKVIEVAHGTPSYCDPSSEAYHSM